MSVLLPLFKFYKRYWTSICLGVGIAIITLLASLFLLSLSGWFLAASAVAGTLGVSTFNYMLPAVGVRASAILRTAARYAERLISHNTTFKILSYLRTVSFGRIMPLSPMQLQQYQKADLLNRFISDIEHLDHFYLKLLSPCVAALLGILAIYFGLSFFNQSLSLFITLTLLITVIVLPLAFFWLTQDLGRTIVAQKNNYRKQLIAYLQGHAELSVFSARPRFRQELDTLETHWLDLQRKQARFVSASQSLLIAIIGIITVSTLVLAMHLNWDYHSPILALFVFISLGSAELLAPLPNAFIFLGQMIASARRIHDLFSTTPSVTFCRNGENSHKTPFRIHFDSVTFHYSRHADAILKRISFTLQPNQHVALIGKTGCGKSTLLKLMTRASDPSFGAITFGDIPLMNFDEKSLRQMISVVPQRIDILSDTLANNLRIAKPEATDEELITLLHQVGLGKLLEDPSGLSLWLGDKGRALSGGEMRRIGIARALLHNAPLMLMDEPTESLDLETESQIIALIRRLCHDKTLLMATHRLTDHRMFDSVYRLDNGIITPFDPHK